MRTSHVAALVASSLATTVAAAQQQQQQQFYYSPPAAGTIRVTADIPFARVDSATLAMDVYRPARGGAAAPALIVYRQSDPRRRPERQTSEWARGWARAAAANGIVGILADLRTTSPAADFGRLLSHLTEHASRYGVDGRRVAVLAASANVTTAFPAVEDPAQTTVAAAVMYYGTADVATFRTDVPVLYVRAGRDHPEMNAEVVRLASLAVSQNAPLTLLNHHTGRHGFESLDDDVATRQVIAQTLDFVQRTTAPEYQALLRARRLDAAAEGYLTTGNYREASRAMASLLAARPTDGLLRFHYAGALLGDAQYAAACAEYRSFVNPPNYMAILPGARACTLAGAIDTTIAWLGRMPKGCVQPRDFESDSVFAPLRARADFQALFRP